LLVGGHGVQADQIAAGAFAAGEAPALPQVVEGQVPMIGAAAEITLQA
jgi:hypothetical protein